MPGRHCLLPIRPCQLVRRPPSSQASVSLLLCLVLNLCPCLVHGTPCAPPSLPPSLLQLSADTMVGMSEPSKCAAITKVRLPYYGMAPAYESGMVRPRRVRVVCNGNCLHGMASGMVWPLPTCWFFTLAAWAVRHLPGLCVSQLESALQCPWLLRLAERQRNGSPCLVWTASGVASCCPLDQVPRWLVVTALRCVAPRGPLPASHRVAAHLTCAVAHACVPLFPARHCVHV